VAPPSPSATVTPVPPSPTPTAARLPPGAPPHFRPGEFPPIPTPTTTPAPVLLVQGATADKVVAFTFDAGADRGYAPIILSFLRAHGLHATFGMTGLWARANADLVAQMVRDGDQVVNHTWDHQSFTGLSTKTPPLSRAAVFAELDRTDAALVQITGSSSRPFWRAPYGDETVGLRQLIADHGYTIDARWTLDSLGWEGLAAPAIVQRVLAAAAPGAIFLMHVGAQSQDALALPSIWAALASAGYRTATLAQLLSSPGSGSTAASSAAAQVRRSSYTAVDPDAAFYPAPRGAAAGGPLSGTVVILDPGHGGDDPGTCYPFTPNCYTTDGLETPPTVLDEKVIALDISLYRLLPLLHANGAAVYLTRTTNDQNPGLETRLQLSRYVVGLTGNSARNVAFISVHLNGSDDPSSDYSLSLYAPGKPHGLAGAIQTMMAARLDPLPAGGDHGLDSFSGHVTRRNPAPSLIAEPVFLTNAYSVLTPISMV
jgi:peptidoglycan/xylan/chitin deacetylase (PgdA/CDA1 family)